MSDGMTRVLIAVDSSESSISAARAAHRLFGDFAQYIVINVAPSPMIWGEDAFLYGMVYPVAITGAGAYPFAMTAPVGTDGPSSEDGAEKTAHDVASAAGLSDATTLGESGDTAHAIVAAATAHRADVIVVGTHDRNWFSRLVMPSIANSVLRESDIPVLVAR
ncbi:hypothetical protein BH10ACT2_BH10ACT2_22250 [soil metagenome]